MNFLSPDGDYVFVGKNVWSNDAIDQLREFSSGINYLRGYKKLQPRRTYHHVRHPLSARLNVDP